MISRTSRPRHGAISATPCAAPSGMALQNDRIDDAARLMLAAAPDTMAPQDTDCLVARAALARPQAARPGQVQDRLRRGARAGGARDGSTIASTTTSCAAGSRCAISTIPKPRPRISPRSTKAQPIRPRCRGRATGAAARPKPWGRRTRCARIIEAAARYPTAYYGQLARQARPRPDSSCARPRPFSAVADT